MTDPAVADSRGGSCSPSGPDPSKPVFGASDLDCGYGHVPVLHGVTLEVAAGEVVALLGANGAGKTTTLLALSGQLRPSRGEVLWKGDPARAPLFKRARAGLRFVMEDRSVIMGLSTLDNLRLGGGSVTRALELFPELQPLLHRRAGLLSGGEQQILTLARALAASPVALLADELSLGLAPQVVQRLLTAVKDAASQSGMAVLLVEQQVRSALTVADRAYVLQRGRLVLQGTSTELLSRLPEIEASYLSGVGVEGSMPDA